MVSAWIGPLPSPYAWAMCRSIKRLRTPEGLASEEEIREAARQYVRKVSGFHHPSPVTSLAGRIVGPRGP